MLHIIHSILKEQRFCVLATYTGKSPYCSLMSYGTDDDCSEIYMTTIKGSTKYRNIRMNPLASLLIDTRENRSARKGSLIKSLTVMGKIREIDDLNKNSEIRINLAEKNSDLGIILDNRHSVVLALRIKSFLLLDGIDKPYFIEAG